MDKGGIQIREGGYRGVDRMGVRREGRWGRVRGREIAGVGVGRFMILRGQNAVREGRIKVGGGVSAGKRGWGGRQDLQRGGRVVVVGVLHHARHLVRVSGRVRFKVRVGARVRVRVRVRVEVRVRVRVEVRDSVRAQHPPAPAADAQCARPRHYSVAGRSPIG